MTKNIRLFSLLAILISISIIYSSCGTVEDIFGNDVEPESGILTLERYSLVPGEVSTINADYELPSGIINGYIDAEEISFDAIGNALYFSVPNLQPGSYEIAFNIDDIDYSFPIEIEAGKLISNPIAYVENAQNFGVELYNTSLELEGALTVSGIIDSAQSIINQQALQNQLSKANLVFSQMTEEEKAEFAKIFSANEYWINEFQQMFLQNFKSSHCESLLEAGNVAKNAGKIYEARDHFLKYKHCKIDHYTNNSLVYYLNKFNKLIDDYTGDNNKSTLTLPIVPVVMALAFVYFVWTRMDAEIQAINTNPFADDLTDEKVSNTSFVNNQKTNYSSRVKFRAVDQNDINRQDIFGMFVGLIHDANKAIKRLLTIVPDPDVRPISLTSSNETVDFNRNFVIQNINNSNVTLKSSAIVDDLWEVIFETVESEDQEFQYDLVYNDGKTQLTKQVSATISIGDPLLGTWEAIEVDGQAVGEWQYYYLEDNCPDLIGWASITHKATLTLDGSNIIFFYDGSDKDYQYTGLDYTTCTYESLNINESSDDDSYTSTYTHDANTIIVETNDGPFPMNYQFLDQNTLIVTADGEVNKYMRK